jgi:transaldolase/glucose-6-phosphate isomerase
MSTITTSLENPLKQLARFGQSIWLDYIRRSLMTSGELRRMVQEDGLGGMTSNPSIFEKAIEGGEEYGDYLAELRKDKSLDAKGIYERLAIRDIQDAADVLRPVYASTNQRDGYVSLEVAPYLAHKTQETIDEALRLWKAVDRPNLMIKIPGTPAGVPAVETVLREGVNVNVTLLFAQEMYEEVAWAYVRALEQRAAQGLSLAGMAGVASFFVSRIDTAVDALIDARLAQAPTVKEEQRNLLESVRSKVAIANAKLAYERYQRIFSGPRWEALAAKGAQSQRVLWASTSTKNPKLRDVLYIEELIGKDTVNTIPPATYDAFKDHGRPRASLVEDVEGARRVMANLAAAEISMQAVTADLVVAGVKQFEDAFTKLLAVVHAQ